MPHMPVPLPRMCSVLAHELRSPLSVIQGYIRLLQRQRDAEHPDMPMLEAMLEATGRLTTIARQASDLGNWMSGPATRPLEATQAGSVMETLAQRLGTDARMAVLAYQNVSGQQFHADAAALTGALAAVAEAMHRDMETGVVEISLVDPPDGGSVAFTLRPRRAATATTALSSRSGTPRAFSFDRGGAGLALIAASHVLDVHQAAMEPADDAGALTLRFPQTGGTR